MNIAVDFDGVLSKARKKFTEFMDNANTELCNNYNIPCNLDSSVDISCANGISFFKRYHIDKLPRGIYARFFSDFVRRYSEYMSKYTKSSISVKNAGEVLKKLYGDGHTLFLITTRGTVNPNFTDTPSFDAAVSFVNKLEEKYKFKFKDYIGGNPDKANAYINHKINIVIDDSIYHCVEAAENKIYGINLLTSKSNYDSDFKDRIDANKDYIVKAKDWNEVYKIINNLPAVSSQP